MAIVKKNLTGYSRKKVGVITLLAFVALVFCLHPERTYAAVAFDASSESHTGVVGSANETSFSWTHTPAGTPKGVLIYVWNDGTVAQTTSVTYGGVDVPAVNGGVAVDTAGETGRMAAFFLGSGIPTGQQTVVVNRTSSNVELWAVAVTVTAAQDTEVYEPGIVLLQEDGTLAVQSVTDGSNGINSVRFAGAYSGLNSVPAAGTGSTVLQDFDTGNFVGSVVRENTAGQGARNVGFSSGTSDDRAVVHLAVREQIKTITGTCKKADGTTNCGNGEVIKWAINGTLQGTTGTTSSGAFTISPGTFPTTGQVVTVFVDNVVDSLEAVAVTKYDGSGNITGVELIEGALTIGSGDNQTITNANIGSYDNSVSGDEDVFIEYSASSFTCDTVATGFTGLCVDGTGQFSSTEKIYVLSGNTYQPGSAIRTGKIEINGTFNVNTSFELAVTGVGTGTSRPIYFNAGSYTNSGSGWQIRYLGGSGDVAVSNVGTSDASIYITPTLSTTPITYTPLGAMTTGSLSISPDGGGSSRTLNFNLAGTLTVSSLGVSASNSGTVVFSTTGSNYTLTSSGAVGFQSGTTFNANGSTVTAASLSITDGSTTVNAGSSSITLSGTGTPFSTNGIFNAGTGTFIYSGTSASITNVTYNNLTLGGSGIYYEPSSLTVGGDLVVNGTVVPTVSSISPSYIAGFDADGSTNGSTGVNVNASAIYGNYLILGKAGNSTACSQTAGSSLGCEILIYDVSTKQSPVYVAGRDISGSSNGTDSVNVSSLFVSGNYLYVVTEGSSVACSQLAGSAKGCEFQIYDISTPTNPTYVSGLDSSGSSNGTGSDLMLKVFVSGNYAYLGKIDSLGGACSQSAGSASGCELMVINVTTKSSPTYAAGRDRSGSSNGANTGEIRTLYVQGNYLYVATSNNSTACAQSAGSAIGCELQVYDVTTPSSPTFSAGLDSDGSSAGTTAVKIWALTASGNYLYAGKDNGSSACSQSAGSASGCELMVFDISTPSSPSYAAGRDIDGSSTGSGVVALNIYDLKVFNNYLVAVKSGNATACSSSPGSGTGCEMMIFDITTLNNPTYTAGMDSGGSTTGTQGGAIKTVSISANYGYVGKSANTSSACSQVAGSAVGCELMAFSLGTYTSSTLTVGGNTTLGNGGIYTAGATSVTLRGNLTLNSVSAWLKGSATLLFAKGGGNTQTITDNNNMKQDLGAVQVSANSGNTSLTLGSNITVSSVTVDLNQTLNVGTNLNLTGTGTPFVMNGSLTGSGYINYAAPSGSVNVTCGITYFGVEIFGGATNTLCTGAGQTFTVTDYLYINKSGGGSSPALTAATNNPTIVGPTLTEIGDGTFIGGSGTLTTGQLLFDGSSATFTAGSGDIVITGVGLDKSSGTWTKGSGTLIFKKSGGGTLTVNDSSATPQDLGAVQISANGGNSTLNLSSNVKVTSLTIDLNQVLDTNGTHILEITGTGTPLVVNGSLTGNGTIEYVASSGAVNVTCSNLTYYRLYIGPGATYTLCTAGSQTLNVTQDLNIEATTTAATNNPTINVSTLGIYVGASFGALTTGSGDINTPYLELSSNGALTEGSGTIYLTSGLSIGVNTTWTKGSGNIVFKSGNGSAWVEDDHATPQDLGNIVVSANGTNTTLTPVTNIKFTSLTVDANQIFSQGASYNITTTGAGTVITVNGTWSNIGTGDIVLSGDVANAGVITLNSNNGSQCSDGTDDIAITSSVGGTQRNWTGAGTFTIYNVAATDQKSTTNVVTAYTSTLTNTTWTIGSCGGGVTISGSTNAGDGISVHVAINGTPDDTHTGSTSSGTWSISSVSISSGQTAVIWFDNVADSAESTAVAKYDGTGDMTGIVLNTNVLSIGSVDDQSITYANMDTYDCNSDEDVMYATTATSLAVQGCTNSYTDETIQIESGDTLTEPAASTFTSDNLTISGTLTQTTTGTITLTGNLASSGTFNGGSGDVTVVNYTQTAGTFTSTSGTLNVSGNWTHTAGGTFSHNNGTVNSSNGTDGGTPTWDFATSETFYNFATTGGSVGFITLTISSGDSLIVLNTFTHGGTRYAINTGTIEARGNVVINSTANGGTATISFLVSGDQTITTNGGSTASLNINKPSGTVSVATGSSSNLSIVNFTLSSGTFTAPSGNLNVSGNWTHTAGGTFSHNNGTVNSSNGTDGGTPTWDFATSETFYNFATTGSSVGFITLTISSGDSLIVLNTFTHGGTRYSISTGTIEARGNVVINSSANGGNATLTFTGSAAQTYTDNGGNEIDGDITINKSGGSLTLASNADWNASNQDVTITQGTLDLATFTATTNTVSIGASGTLTGSSGKLALAGTATPLSNSGAITGGSVQYTGATATILGTTYSGLILGGTGTYTLPASDVTIRGDMTVTTGATVTKSASNKLIFAKGGGGTQTLTGNATNSDLGLIQVSANTGNTTLSLGSSIKAAKITIDASQTLAAGSNTITLTGSGTTTSRPLYNNGGTVTVSSATVNYEGTSATDIEATTYNNLGVGTNSGDTGAGATYSLLGATTVTTTLTIGNSGSTNADNLSTSASNYLLTAGNINVTNKGQLAINGSGLVLTGTGTPLNLNTSGIFHPGTCGTPCSVVQYTGSSAYVATTTFNALILGSGSSATYTLPNGNLILKDDLTINNNATVNKVSGTVIFSKGDIQDFTDNNSSKQDIGAVQVSASSTDTTLRLGSNAKLSSLVLDASQTFTTNGSRTLTITGTGTPLNVGASAAFTTSSGSTVDYTGNGAIISATSTYYNLGLKPSGASQQVLGTAAGQTITVNGDLTVGDGSNAGATFATNNPTLNVSGNSTIASGATLTTGTGTWTQTGDLTVTGTLSGTANGTISVAGNFSGGGTVNLTTAGTIEHRVGNSVSFGPTSSNDWTFVNLTFGRSAGTPTITTDTSGTGNVSVSGVLNIGKSGDATATNLDAGDIVWTLSGNGAPLVFNVSSTLTPNASTFNYTYPSGGGSITVATSTYYNLGIGTASDSNAASTFTLGGDVVVQNNLTVGNSGSSNADTFSTAGSNYSLTAKNISLTSKGALNANSSTISISDNFANAGTFTAGTGTVVFNGANESQITGGTTFNNLTSTVENKILSFEAGSTYRINGTLTLQGSANQPLQVQSTSAGNQWLANFQGALGTLQYVRIKDAGCDAASNAIDTTNSTGVVSISNNGNCWLFFSAARYGGGGGGSYGTIPSQESGSGPQQSGGGSGGSSGNGTGEGSGGGQQQNGGGSGGGGGGGDLGNVWSGSILALKPSDSLVGLVFNFYLARN